jgi:hypothetical protein
MSQPVDWPALLGTMIQVKNEIDQRDPEHVEPYTLPRVKASAAELAAYEQQIGHALPAAYREFLRHADGWPSFYFDMDLFGLPELRDGAGNAGLAARLLDEYDREGVLGDIGLSTADVTPIGAGAGMRDLLLLVRSGDDNAGQVSWLDGEEVDRYADVAEYLDSMIEYARIRASKLPS